MRCRSCGGGSLGDVVDLGNLPLVNNLLGSPRDPCPRYELRAVYCRACSLIQLTATPPPQAMFDHYLYFTSQSRTMLQHAGALVERFVQPGQSVLEIASNDGYLLKQAQAAGARVLGIEPARNVAQAAANAGVPTRSDYFTADVGNDVARQWGRADVIFANNVLAHVPDPNEIVRGISAALAPNGVAHLEVPYAMRMIEFGAFDTMYHEHHSYFSASALKSLFNWHELRIIGIEEIAIHGGSLHIQVAHAGDESAAERICHREALAGIHGDAYYRGFARRVATLRRQLDAVLRRFECVAGYGAAAKGVVMLNVFQLGPDRVRWVADVSPHKQGKHVPGTGQRIVHPAQLNQAKPDAVLMLAWNLRDEIVETNREYLDGGGCFIVPLPRLGIVSRTGLELVDAVEVDHAPIAV